MNRGRVARTLDRYLGGTNLEVFKFGMYILFPISWMYYFGTNLDERFTVKGLIPTQEQSHKIPTEREDLEAEIKRLRERRLALRAKRLEQEKREQETAAGDGGVGSLGTGS